MILGAGAIGGLWACELTAAGRPPLLLLRDEPACEKVRRQGLTLHREGRSHRFEIPCSSVQHCARPIEHLLVTTKAHQTLAALRPLLPLLAEEATVVLMQNGLGVADELLARSPNISLYQASTTEGAHRPTPFEIVHAGRGETLLGRPGGALDDSLRHCAESLSGETVRVRPCEDIERVLWRKLAVNAVINPLTALHRCRNGALLEQPETRRKMQSLIAEITTLSVHTGRAPWVADLADVVHRVASATARNRSSMLQDVEAGRTTEIDYINGYLCQLAEWHGLALPVNRELLDQITGLR